MKIESILLVTLHFLIIYIQISINDVSKENGVCYFPGSNQNTILEEENLTFPVPINTSINYICFYNDTFIQGNSSVQCLENGNWSGELPICGYTTSNCKSSDKIEKVIFIDGKCIHFSKQIRLNYQQAQEECINQVHGEIFMGEDEKLLNLIKYTNESIRYYWIQTSQSMKNDGNDSANKETLSWQNCTNILGDCCNALTNDMTYPLMSRDCARSNSWICQSEPIGLDIECRYPERNPVTLMYITKENKKSPLEVKYYCPEGFTLEGDETRECRENRTWSGEAPSCISNDSGILPNSINETAVSPDDSMEEKEHRFNVYTITGIGTLAAILLITIGIILYRRKRTTETIPIHNISPREINSFDSETLVSTEELYEEIILDRRDDFRLDDDGYVSTEEVKRNEGESVSSDKIKRTLPTLNEERHSHLEDQNSVEMSNLPGVSSPKEINFVMVENDLYRYSDSD